jgi:hypothetical protein
LLLKDSSESSTTESEKSSSEKVGGIVIAVSLISNNGKEGSGESYRLQAFNCKIKSDANKPNHLWIMSNVFLNRVEAT